MTTGYQFVLHLKTFVLYSLIMEKIFVLKWNDENEYVVSSYSSWAEKSLYIFFF